VILDANARHRKRLAKLAHRELDSLMPVALSFSPARAQNVERFPNGKTSQLEI